MTARPPWCPTCERFPGLLHRHEFFDRETLQPFTDAAVTAPVTALPAADVDALPRRRGRGRALRAGVRRHAA